MKNLPRMEGNLETLLGHNYVVWARHLSCIGLGGMLECVVVVVVC